MKIKANGISYPVKLHQANKSKPFLILLHGFMGSGRIFYHLIEDLQEFCNPVTIDLLGHGKSDKGHSSERFQTQKQIEDLSLIIQKVSNKPVYLYGYSMGGRLALQLAQVKPELLKGLILESVNPGLKNKKERNERKRLDEQRAKKIESDLNTFLEEWKQLPLFNNEAGSEEDLKRYQKIQQQQDPQQMSFSLQGFGTGQMPMAKLDEIKTPVLLLAGEKDQKYVRIMKGMDQQLSKSQLKIISDASHRIHLNKPDAIINELKAFVT